jgi:hypothetical protein
MKTILLGVVAALALTSLPAVHAEDRVDVKAARTPARYFMAASEFRQFSNRYELQNGQQVVFKQFMTQRYVTLDDGQQLRIYATSPKTFVTESGVRFEFRDDGENLAITDFAKLPLAKAGSADGMVMAAARW